MARDYEGQSTANRVIIFSLLLVLIVLVGAIYLIRLFNRSYQDYEVMNRLANTEENLGGYLEHKGGIVKYSKDGAVAVNSKGNYLWNGSFEMTDPIADACGDYVVVADRGGKQIQIFNKKGLAGSIKTNHPIVRQRLLDKEWLEF